MKRMFALVKIMHSLNYYISTIKGYNLGWFLVVNFFVFLKLMFFCIDVVIFFSCIN